MLLMIPFLWLRSSVLESPSRLDEEHRLIARYAARLAAEAGNSTVSVSCWGASASQRLDELLLAVMSHYTGPLGGRKLQPTKRPSSRFLLRRSLKKLPLKRGRR